MLSEQTKAIVKATAPVLADHGLSITTHFYKRMFEHHPEVRNLFNQGHQAAGQQQHALAGAVYAYAQHIDHPEVLAGALNHIAHKHASLNIRPEHYPIVGEHLLASIREVLGAAATDEVIDAWAAAYGQLADMLMAAEARLYADSEQRAGGWSGWRPYEVRRKVAESSEITSFYLHPRDGAPAPDFKPGQYISVRRPITGLGITQPRQYSLSDAPNREYLRITVKREGANQACPAGMVSNSLHDELQVGDHLDITPPFGDFHLHQDRDGPVVLISAGVGQTPMISMLNTLLQGGSRRQIVFVHAARNGQVHAMKSHLATLSTAFPQLRRHVFYETVTEEDRRGDDYDHAGRMDLLAIRDDVLLPEADYYLCGPIPFMKVQRDALLRQGVAEEKILYEVFGTATMD